MSISRTVRDQLLAAMVRASGEITSSNADPPQSSRSASVAPFAGSILVMDPSFQATTITLASGAIATARAPNARGWVRQRSRKSLVAASISMQRRTPSSCPTMMVEPSALRDASAIGPSKLKRCSGFPVESAIVSAPPFA